MRHRGEVGQGKTEKGEPKGPECLPSWAFSYQKWGALNPTVQGVNLKAVRPIRGAWAKRKTEEVGCIEFSGREGEGVGVKIVSQGPGQCWWGWEVPGPKSGNAGGGENRTCKIILFSFLEKCWHQNLSN